MKNSTLIFSLFFCIVSIGCARTVTKQPLESTATKPVLTYDQIVGTWVSGSISDKENIYSEESFLVDGTYCLVEVNTASPAHVFTYSKGTWDYNSTYEPYIGITVKSSTKPSQIAAGGASEVRLIRNYTGSSIYMGYSCPHCSGGLLGAVYSRSPVERSNQVCDAWRPTTQSRGPP